MTDGEVRIEYLLRHPPERVFAAWTDATHVARWMCPGDGSVVQAIADPRVGGEFHVVMNVAPGVNVEHDGHYVTIDPPNLVELTWRSVNTDDRDTLLSVSIAPHEDGARLTLVHRGLPEPTTDSHRLGWESILGHLQHALASDTP
jgi:uncharacterized protein YndB with AHSA1/START domain